MKHGLLKLYTGIQILRQDGGQDLVEYALLVALIALGATASMSSLATQIGTAFAAVGTKLSGYTS